MQPARYCAPRSTARRRPSAWYRCRTRRARAAFSSAATIGPCPTRRASRSRAAASSATSRTQRL